MTRDSACPLLVKGDGVLMGDVHMDNLIVRTFLNFSANRLPTSLPNDFVRAILNSSYRF